MKASLKLLILIGLSCFINLNTWAQDSCGVETFFPHICYEMNPLDNSEFKYWIEWSEAYPDTALIDTLLPKNERHLHQWKIFWELGDGTFRSGQSTDTIVHSYRTPGGRKIRTRATPIKTKNEEPPAEARALDINVPTGNPAVTNSNFDSTETTILKADAHWNALRLRDTVTTYVTYRNLDQITRPGRIDVVMPPGLKFVAFRPHPDTSDFENLAFEDGLLSWEFELDPLGAEEHTLFVDVVIEEEGVGEDSTIQFIGNLYWTDQDEPEENTVEYLFRYVVGAVNVDGNNDVPTLPGTASRRADASDDYSMRVNRSRDPNRISVIPETIFPGKKSHSFEYTIDFQNLGDAPAEHVRLLSFLSSDLDTNTLFDAHDWHPQKIGTEDVKFAELKNETSTDLPCIIPAPTPVHFPEWQLCKPISINYLLRGTGEFDDIDSIQEAATKGFLKYRISTVNRKFKVGERIPAFALIVMDGDELMTDTIYTEVVRKRGLPPGFGIKGGINQPNITGATTNSPRGWHAGITYKFKFPFTASLPSTFQDAIYIQPELLIQRQNFILPTNQSYKSWDLSLPLQARVVPNFGGYRLVGVSVGYVPALTLGATNEGTKVEFNNFGDRFSQGFFYDVAVGNILWKYGLSLGFRQHFGQKINMPAGAITYNLTQIYLHFNL